MGNPWPSLDPHRGVRWDLALKTMIPGLLSTDDPVYTKRAKVRGYTSSQNVLTLHYFDSGRLLRARLPHFTKLDHLKHADMHFKAMRWLEDEYNQSAEEALKMYGSHGPLISGSIRDHFPGQVKDRFRTMASGIWTHRNVGLAHWAAAGKRKRPNLE